MTFSFYNTIPATPDNPSNDQPLMLINNQSIDSILAVDHIGFNSAGGGEHLQVTLNATPSYITTPVAPTGNDSIAYTAAGTASTAAQLLFVNSNATVQLSAIRAWATCDSAGAFLGSQKINVASVVHSSTGTYAVTLSANAVSSNQFAVFICQSSSSPIGIGNKYSITGTGTFQVLFFNSAGVLIDPITFSFQVLQI